MHYEKPSIEAEITALTYYKNNIDTLLYLLDVSPTEVNNYDEDYTKAIKHLKECKYHINEHIKTLQIIQRNAKL